jgi:hypothetical protein
MASSGMLCHVALVRTDVSEELSASIIRVTRISELGTLTVTATGARCGEIQKILCRMLKFIQKMNLILHEELLCGSMVVGVYTSMLVPRALN